jgi:hypothetical protein
LLKNNFIRIIDHNALPSIQNLEELTYCKWHNSSYHNTSNCNVFHRVIQSAIDNGQLRFSEAQQMNQLDSIGFDGKQVLNRLALTNSLKAQDSSAQERCGALKWTQGLLFRNCKLKLLKRTVMLSQFQKKLGGR